MSVRSTVAPKQRASVGVGSPFSRFADQWAVRLTTYRRDGTPVGTAVNVAVAGEKAYFRTYEETWKWLGTSGTGWSAASSPGCPECGWRCHPGHAQS
jgi:hypothetical protein